MPTLDDVYRKFGETAEAAQLLETELGNVLLLLGAFEDDLLAGMNRSRAADLLSEIDTSTLGGRRPSFLTTWNYSSLRHSRNGTVSHMLFIASTIPEEIRMRDGPQ